MKKKYRLSITHTLLYACIVLRLASLLLQMPRRQIVMGYSSRGYLQQVLHLGPPPSGLLQVELQDRHYLGGCRSIYGTVTTWLDVG